MRARSGRTRKLALVQLAAAGGIVLAALKPWISIWFGPDSNNPTDHSIEKSWTDYVSALNVSGATGLQQLQPLLVTAGAAVAIAFTFFVLVQGWRSTVLSAIAFAGFVGASIGVIWLLVQFDQVSGVFAGYAGYAGYHVTPSLGLWIFLAAAVIGAFATLPSLTSPDAAATLAPS